MKHGSLFSGIGGFDLAAEWMGWENVFHCEWMEFPRKVLDYYWPYADSHTDICKTDFTKYEGTVDIISGGFPCQPFSLAGKRKGTSDERYLWHEMLRAIREVKPKWVIAENVFGITNIDGGMVFEQVCLDLEAEGYEVQPFIIPAAAKNAPHRRDRCFFVAYSRCYGSGTRPSKGICKEWEKPINENGNDMGIERISKNATNPDLSGNTTLRNRIDGNGAQESIEWEQPLNEFGRPIVERNATHTDSNGQHERNGHDESNASERGINAFGNFEQSNGNGNATDTSSIGQECREKGKFTEGKSQSNDKQFERCSKLYRTNFEMFPTQSPICSGDDGLPTQLDGITFSKWRNESIKGYGNAIVPQIAYQLFQIIDELQKLD